MGITVAVTRFQAQAASGNQDVTTTDLGGLTPKAALFFWSSATADDTATDHAQFGVGAAADGSGAWYCVSRALDNESLSKTYARVNFSWPIGFLDAGGGISDRNGSLGAWLTNGCRINWIQSGDQRLVTAVFFAGSDLSAYVGSVDLEDVDATSVDVTAPGFEPQDVIVAACPHLGDALGAGPPLRISLGAVHNGGSVNEVAASFTEPDGVSPVAYGAQVTDDYSVIEVDSSDASRIWGANIGSFDANGFTVTTSGAANDTRMGYLALNYGGITNSWLGLVSTPDSTGNQSITAPGFKPQAVMHFLTGLGDWTIDSGMTSLHVGSKGASAFTETTEFSVAASSQHNVATSNTLSWSDDEAISFPNHSGSFYWHAAFVSMDDTGWTVNHTTSTAQPRFLIALAIEVGPVEIALNKGEYAVTGHALTVAPGEVTAALALGAQTITGYTLTVVPGEAIAALALGELVITGYGITIADIVDLALGSLSVTGHALTVAAGATSFGLALGEFAVTGYGVAVSYDLEPDAPFVITAGGAFVRMFV